MAVNIHITIIELNALHTKRQNLFQELDAVIHLLMEAKHWGLRKSKIGRAVQQECRDRPRMPSSARKKKRRQVGEGDGQDAIERGPAGADERDDPRHELGGLAGASSRLHYQGSAEIRLDALPRPGVGEGGGHGMLLSCTRACSASGGLRRVRFHSEGPQTAR